MTQKIYPCSIPLCSRCFHNEVQGWLNNHWREINQEAKKQINEELKTIKLKKGECIVCNSELICEDIQTKILQILQENKTPEKVIQEFKIFFGV